MTARSTNFALSLPRYLPTFAGTAHPLRVRSGLMRVQLLPPLVVLHSVFEAK
jgi:hypothetical protein